MESCAELRAAQAGERILRGLRLLAEAGRDLVVVTNEVFGDIKLTEEETAAYQRLMGRLNRELFPWQERSGRWSAGSRCS